MNTRSMRTSASVLRKAVFLCLFLFSLPVVAQRTASSVLILCSGLSRDEYAGEMLKAEGFHSVNYLDTKTKQFSVAEMMLSDLVIVPRMSLSVAEVATLMTFLKAGGSLVVLRPSAVLSTALGFTGIKKTITGGYLAINRDPLGQGLLRQPLQWHGEAEVFQPRDTRRVKQITIADLLDSKGEKMNSPAVALIRKAKGRAVVFLYDLSLSTMLTRQGNEKLAGNETDSIKGIRAMDMFTGGWVDTAKNTLNQSDEQLRLLSRCIETLTANRKPEPRCWYFPDSLKSLIVLTNDGEYRRAADFASQFADVAAHNARMTLYVLSPEKIDSAFADSSRRLGFEIAAHPDATAQAENPSWAGVDLAIKTKIASMSRFPGVSPIRTNTNHWFVWCGTDSAGQPDFSAGAKLEARNEIRVDVNYAHYDNKAGTKRFLGPTGYRQGNFTGSGLPMKFGSTDGSIVDVYQLFNNVYDQQYMENQDPDGYDSCFRGLLDRSLDEEIYSCVCIRSHNDEYFFSRAPLMRMLEYADKKKIPVWPVNRLLDFLAARDSVSFDNISWKDHRLSFRLNSRVKGRDKPTVMLPAEFEHRKLIAVRSNGIEIRTSKQLVKGKTYCWFSFSAGSPVDIVAAYK